MRKKINSKNVLAVLFVASITICGLLTLALSPKQIVGGLVRGYTDAPEDNNPIQKIGNSFKTFDARISEFFALHDVSIHVYGGVQNVLNRSLIDDADKSSEVIKLNNGYLTFKENSDTEFSGLSDYLTELKSVCNSTGSELMYVKKISKGTTDESLNPDFYPYVYQTNYNEIKPELIKSGISILDFEQVVQEQNIDKYSLFFRTDHHWTPQTGLWVSENIAAQLNKEYGWHLDEAILDISNFKIDNYPKSFLGSQGKRVGALFDGVDDFSVVKPDFETSLTVEMSDKNETVTGTFEETMLHKESITPDNLLNKDDTAYDTYMRGNHPLVKIKNHKITNGKKALLVLDSYGCVVAPFLSLEFQQLDCIDIRSYTDSVKDYITESKPDVVIYFIENYQK
jgi:hypothetical protein